MFRAYSFRLHISYDFGLAESFHSPYRTWPANSLEWPASDQARPISRCSHSLMRCPISRKYIRNCFRTLANFFVQSSGQNRRAMQLKKETIAAISRVNGQTNRDGLSSINLPNAQIWGLPNSSDSMRFSILILLLSLLRPHSPAKQPLVALEKCLHSSPAILSTRLLLAVYN